MHIAFAALFFFFVGMSETLRHGIFGLNPSETTGMIVSAMIVCALIILRSDVISLLRRPQSDMYGNARLNWTLPRTFLGLLLGPLLLIVPLAYGFALIQINLNAISTENLVQAFALQIAVIAFAEELFFREAVVKAFRSNISAMYVISALSGFIYYIPGGLPAALIATGAGLYYMTLRLIGTNLLVVAALHAATVFALDQVFSLGLTPGEMWPYAIYFFAAAGALSIAVYSLFSKPQEDLIHA